MNNNDTQSTAQQPMQQGSQESYPNYAGTNQQVIVQTVEHKSNGIGTAGFVLALLGLVLCWIPILDFILWFLGLIFSIIGCFKSPKGLAITGLILSLIGIIAIIGIVGTIGAIFA